MPLPYFHVYLFAEKKSIKVGKIKELLPSDHDLDYTMRILLYDRLKSYMDERRRSDFIISVREKEYYYKVHLESLGGDHYDTPSSFINKYRNKYNEFAIDGCSLKLEYEIDC